MQMDKDIVRLELFTVENELELIAHFGIEENCFAYLANYKCRDGLYCTSCGCTEYYQSMIKRYYRFCKACIRLVSPTS